MFLNSNQFFGTQHGAAFAAALMAASGIRHARCAGWFFRLPNTGIHTDIQLLCNFACGQTVLAARDQQAKN